MMPRSLATALALLLTISLVAPSAFLLSPPRARAVDAVTVIADVSSTNVGTLLKSTITAIKETLIEAHTFTSMIADQAQLLNMEVLQPLAFVLSGNLMKMMTAGVIQFVIGKANGTGVPQFVTDVQKSLQTVGDAKALAFFDQFGRNSNSPFAASISSSLRNDYLSKTSLAGFWAANMNTLARSTPSYRPGYLAGNWSQGGIAAWFALTTQTQNNPYTLYPAAQATLGTLIGPGVGGATGARLTELGWGQGFASWCGASDTTIGALSTTNNATPNNCPAGSNYIAASGQCEYGDGSKATPLNSSTGLNPGDACTNKDGTPGTIKTPGSVIVSTLNKVLGGQQDIVTRMGNVGPEINGILKNISTVMQTVNFATQILGSASLSGATGGLLGSDTPSGSNSTSRLMQYQNSPGNMGVTNTTVYQNSAALSPSGSDMTSQINQYETAWNTVSAVTNAASTSVATLITYCNAQVTDPNAAPAVINTQVTAAKTALTTEIAPVLARAATAAANIAAARAAAQKLQEELNAGIDTAGATYSADLQAFQTMPPTASDVANIQQEVQSYGSATASPPGSLTVSANSLVDQMNLITTNATALKAVCTPVVDTGPFIPPAG